MTCVYPMVLHSDVDIRHPLLSYRLNGITWYYQMVNGITYMAKIPRNMVCMGWATRPMVWCWCMSKVYYSSNTNILAGVIHVLSKLVSNIQTYRLILLLLQPRCDKALYPESKVHGANMGLSWVLVAPDGLHVGHMNLALMVLKLYCCLVLRFNEDSKPRGYSR